MNESERRARERIEAGMCPLCDRGPFRVMAIHASRIHGVHRRQLIDLAGMRVHDSLCSPEVSEAYRARQIELLASGEAEVPLGVRDKTRPHPRNFSKAGLEAKRESGRALLVRLLSEGRAWQNVRSGQTRGCDDGAAAEALDKVEVN